MEKRPNKLLDNFIKEQAFRARKDISNWRAAIQQAENSENPKRVLLHDLYNEITIDTHLSSEMQKRTLSVRGCKFSLYSKTDGLTDSDVTDLLIRPWFHKFIDLAMESIYYGHSLIQIGEIIDGEIQSVKLVKRRNVVPDNGVFLKKVGDDKGILYREDVSYWPWLLEVGEEDNLGLLNKCAPHVLYKRFAQSAWSEFCELFGMPLRIGKTNVKDAESLNRMENMLVQMATAAYAILDEDEEIDFKETVKSNGGVYDGLIKLCNSEISKAINGAVTGEDSGGGSRAKEEVGERTGDKITNADKEWIEGLINFSVLPKIVALGLPFDNFGFRYEVTKNIDEVWKVTEGLLKHYDIEPEYINDTFGIPVKEKKTPPPSGLNFPSFF